MQATGLIEGFLGCAQCIRQSDQHVFAEADIAVGYAFGTRNSQRIETGAVYAMRTKGFQEAGHRFFGKIALHEMPRERVLEIDDPVDFQVAEVVLREQLTIQNTYKLPNPIDALVLDFDGVFTDNKVLVLEDGREAVISNRGDGFGIAQLKQKDFPILIISSEANPVVQARAKKLNIASFQGVSDKLEALTEWSKENNLQQSRIVYLGNDVNDVSCLRAVGCGVVVADAHPMAKSAADIILSVKGGEGAIRELTDLIIRKMANH